LKKFEEIGSLPADSLVSQVKLGDEILEINGQTPDAALQELRRLTGSSSLLANEITAAVFFFNRTFSYPRSNKIILKLKNSSGQINTVEMPWVQISRGVLDTSASLYDRQIMLLENSNSRSEREATQGTVTTQTVITSEENLFRSEHLLTQSEIFSNMTAAKTYFVDNEGEKEALTHALVRHNNKLACYLRIDTFSLQGAGNLKYALYEEVGPQHVQQDAISVIKSFLETCEVSNYKLLIDLKHNPGGDPKYALEIYHMLADQNRPPVSLAINYLIRNGNTNFILQLLSDFNPTAPSVNHQLLMSAFQRDLSETHGVTDWIVMRPKNTTAVFNQPLTLLTSANCISSCDLFAHMIKNGARGRIVGTATNGTGMGFTAATAGSQTALSEFRDTLNYFKVKIPNQAFSTTSASGTNSSIEDNNAVGFTLPLADVQIIENRPVQPDVELDFTLKDYTDGYEDYLRVIERFM